MVIDMLRHASAPISAHAPGPNVRNKPLVTPPSVRSGLGQRRATACRFRERRDDGPAASSGDRRPGGAPAPNEEAPEESTNSPSASPAPRWPPEAGADAPPATPTHPARHWLSLASTRRRGSGAAPRPPMPRFGRSADVADGGADGSVRAGSSGDDGGVRAGSSGDDGGGGTRMAGPLSASGMAGLAAAVWQHVTLRSRAQAKASAAAGSIALPNTHAALPSGAESSRPTAGVAAPAATAAHASGIGPPAAEAAEGPPIGSAADRATGNSGAAAPPDATPLQAPTAGRAGGAPPARGSPCPPLLPLPPVLPSTQAARRSAAAERAPFWGLGGAGSGGSGGSKGSGDRDGEPAGGQAAEEGVHAAGTASASVGAREELVVAADVRELPLKGEPRPPPMVHSLTHAQQARCTAVPAAAPGSGSRTSAPAFGPAIGGLLRRVVSGLARRVLPWGEYAIGASTSARDEGQAAAGQVPEQAIRRRTTWDDAAGNEAGPAGRRPPGARPPALDPLVLAVGDGDDLSRLRANAGAQRRLAARLGARWLADPLLALWQLPGLLEAQAQLWRTQAALWRPVEVCFGARGVDVGGGPGSEAKGLCPFRDSHASLSRERAAHQTGETSSSALIAPQTRHSSPTHTNPPRPAPTHLPARCSSAGQPLWAPLPSI
jgi:hypothetical protein